MGLHKGKRQQQKLQLLAVAATKAPKPQEDPPPFYDKGLQHFPIKN